MKLVGRMKYIHAQHRCPLTNADGYTIDDVVRCEECLAEYKCVENESQGHGWRLLGSSAGLLAKWGSVEAWREAISGRYVWEETA